MIRLLSDHNVEQQLSLIWDVFDSTEWLRFQVAGRALFPDVGLAISASDRLVWELCQSSSLLLVTGNRNAKGSDALTNVIAELNQANSLPVLTIGNVGRVLDFSYREDYAYRIATIAIGLDDLRGAGRLYIP